MVNRLFFAFCVVLALLVGFILGIVWDYSLSGGVTGLTVSPSDSLGDDKIFVYDDKVVINVEGARIVSYESTGSMLPTLDSGTNGISIEPVSVDQINVGDIVSFRRDSKIIVHRVIDKGSDEGGVYFITKGDSSPVADGRVRFEQIEGILVGLVY